MKYCIILLAILISCARPGDSPTEKGFKKEESTPDILASFPLNRTLGFTAIKNNNAIALDLKRIDHQTMEYRIEINRNWKESMIDYGTVNSKQLASENEIELIENNNNCDLLIKLSRDSLTSEVFAQIRRECKEANKNIGTEEFLQIRSK